MPTVTCFEDCIEVLKDYWLKAKEDREASHSEQTLPGIEEPRLYPAQELERISDFYESVIQHHVSEIEELKAEIARKDTISADMPTAKTMIERHAHCHKLYQDLLQRYEDLERDRNNLEIQYEALEKRNEFLAKHLFAETDRSKALYKRNIGLEQNKELYPTKLYDDHMKLLQRYGLLYDEHDRLKRLHSKLLNEYSELQGGKSCEPKKR